MNSEAENQRKYAENDSRFKSSKVLKELLEKSKQNKEKYVIPWADFEALAAVLFLVYLCDNFGATFL